MKFLLALILLLAGAALGVRQWSTRPATPEASYAVARAMIEERRQAALKSQETNQGYVIDPALADRLLRDSSLVVRTVTIRGLGPVKVARAAIEVPADGGVRSVVRYVRLAHTPPNDWTAAGGATRMEWELKVW